ncbi:MAG: trypsin-like serine protease [Bdellovibrionales bacterium]|nr:trypsin-like serine protease [Oligoflexia bacterium]
MQFQKTFVTVASLLSVSSAFASPAIRGTYLPQDQLPKNVCALYAINLVTTITPIDQNKKPIGPPHSETEAESFYCSATLFRDDAVMTAAHCFQGTIEYVPRLGKTPDGKLVRVDLKMDHVEIRCPGDDGQIETHITTVADGWPHPRFGKKAESAVFDVAVLKTKEKWKTKPMPVLLEDNSVRDLLTANQSCRTFGYGQDNEQKVGILHGLQIKSDIYWSPGTVAFAGVQGVDHGDSGGALVCQDRQGHSYLSGVTSRMHDEDPNTPSYGSYFVATDFNAGWVDFALTHEKLDHESVVLFNFYEVESANEALNQCIQARENEGVSTRDMGEFQTAYNEIAQSMRSLRRDLNNGSKPAGVVRIYLDDPYKAAKGALTQCESMRNFNRRRH